MVAPAQLHFSVADNSSMSLTARAKRRLAVVAIGATGVAAGVGVAPAIKNAVLPSKVDRICDAAAKGEVDPAFLGMPYLNGLTVVSCGDLFGDDAPPVIVTMPMGVSLSMVQPSQMSRPDYFGELEDAAR